MPPELAGDRLRLRVVEQEVWVRDETGALGLPPRVRGDPGARRRREQDVPPRHRDTARGLKRVARAVLHRLRTSAEPNDREHLDDALEKIDKSLAPGSWSDDDHLIGEDRHPVFDDEASAVRSLEKVREDPAVQAVAQKEIARLLAADRRLARAAIDDAVGRGADPARARKMMEDAQERIDRGEFPGAIGDFEEAWKEALKAGR